MNDDRLFKQGKNRLFWDLAFQRKGSYLVETILVSETNQEVNNDKAFSVEV